jgi:hypothetical protein
MSFYSKNPPVEEFSSKNSFFKFFWIWDHFSAKNLTVKSIFFKIHIAKKLFGPES